MPGHKIKSKPVPANDLQFLRHLVATVAYRGEKVLRNPPGDFAATKLSDTSRTPVEILAHINDLFDWAGHLVRGEHVWKASRPADWTEEVERFYGTLKNFDRYLSRKKSIQCNPEKLIQGPLADALTHIGQLAMIRRIAGSPVRGENYFKAEITSGRVGRTQSRKRAEFD